MHVIPGNDEINKPIVDIWDKKSDWRYPGNDDKKLQDIWFSSSMLLVEEDSDPSPKCFYMDENDGKDNRIADNVYKKRQGNL